MPVPSGQRCQLNRNGMLMNKSLRNPVRAQASIISVSRKWFSSPGSCPEDNNWPRENDAQVGYYPTDAPGTPRRIANFKVALGIILEISMVRYVYGTLVSKLLIRDGKREMRR